MYRRSQPEPLPYHRNFRLPLLAGQGSLVVSTTRLLVVIHHIRSPRSEPDYTIRLLVSDYPALAALYDPIWGWDLIGLIGFIWKEMEMLRTYDLRDPALRAEVGLSTVSAPSQQQKRQEKRPGGQAMEMIRAFVVDHPSCNRLAIARHLQRSKTPHLIAQIECLVQIGQLARTHIIRPGGVIEYRYIFAGAGEL